MGGYGVAVPRVYGGYGAYGYHPATLLPRFARLEKGAGDLC